MTKTIVIALMLAPFVSLGQVDTGSLKLADSITITWTIKDFVKKEHTLGYCKDGEQRYLCKIDNMEWYGSDQSEDPPQSQLTRLTIQIGKQSYTLSTSKMFNPNYGGPLSPHQFKIKKFDNYYRLYSFFSDGAGTYTVYWKIFKNKASRELISTREEDFAWQFE